MTPAPTMAEGMERLADSVKAYVPRECPDNRAAEKPLNDAIARVVGMCLHPNTTWSAYQSDTGFTCDDCGADSWGNRSKDGSNRRLHDPVPAYTSSLDAALTLTALLPGLLSVEGSWEPDQPEVWPAWTIRWYPRDKSGHDWHGQVETAATPALALCVTALRALSRATLTERGS